MFLISKVGIIFCSLQSLPKLYTFGKIANIKPINNLKRYTKTIKYKHLYLMFILITSNYDKNFKGVKLKINFSGMGHEAEIF